MISLLFDTVGYFLYPATLLTLFGNTLAIGTVMLTGWPFDIVRLSYFGLMVLFFFAQLFLFLIPVRSKSISCCISSFAIFGVIMMLAIIAFLILPYAVNPELLSATINQVRNRTVGQGRSRPTTNIVTSTALPGKNPPPVAKTPPPKSPPFNLPLPFKRRTEVSDASDDPGIGKRAINEMLQVPVKAPTKRPSAAGGIPSDVQSYLEAILFLIELQIPLIGAVVLYAITLIVTSCRFRGARGCGLAIFGGIAYAFMLPTFYWTFLMFSIARYNVTSWR